MPIKKSHPCVRCASPTYRKGGLCRVCAPPINKKGYAIVFDSEAYARRMPENVVEACAREYLRRHADRVAALQAVGVLPAPPPSLERLAS